MRTIPFYRKSTCDTARDVDMHICVSVCVRASDFLAWFKIFRGYTACLFPEKLSHFPSEPDSTYFISNERKKKDLRSQASLENS